MLITALNFIFEKNKIFSCLEEVLALIFMMVLDLDGHLVESADTYSSTIQIHLCP